MSRAASLRAPEAGALPAEGEQLSGIQEVSAELGVTMRTLRFYEDQGLIEPRRVGTTRIYTRREVARMQLILRGKRLGFSIREIKEFLDLYDADPQHHEQMRQLALRVHDRIQRLRRQKQALEETLGELERIEREALERLPPDARPVEPEESR
ncbi:MerR family DNA-binding transcriptional regulator [Sphingomonas sp. PL-96]|uniref:MerR family transcriptional regulator n=1 Tax=Sphingomonas sp. PL-96 TaxID=2887201 RepID=UPI001E45C294|nr:MerR family DNA-binding transcriptional regulator [Sphingomonas sp. PL-96]MCC2976402.1 MerR family DNA-binding transcriptional regulator [Sphingomonas sp. PL-96]